MKKIITRALFLLFAATALTSCDRYDDDNMQVDMLTKRFTVRARHWEWNESYRRLEYIYNWDEIDRYMYEKGSVSCGVFVREGEYEFLRSLPFVQTYTDHGEVFTRTMSYDIVPGSIAFYIQDSDLAYLDGATQDYTFKITLFWRERFD